MTNDPINALNKWLSLTITLGTGSFPYSWLLSKKLSYVGKYLFSCMKANQALQKMVASATLSTPSVAASGATTVWAELAQNENGIMQCGLEVVVSMPNFNIFEALEIRNE